MLSEQESAELRNMTKGEIALKSLMDFKSDSMIRDDFKFAWAYQDYLQAVAGGGHDRPDGGPGRSLETDAKVTWNALPALREEFGGEFNTYLAYRRSIGR